MKPLEQACGRLLRAWGWGGNLEPAGTMLVTPVLNYLNYPLKQNKSSLVAFTYWGAPSVLLLDPQPHQFSVKWQIITAIQFKNALCIPSLPFVGLRGVTGNRKPAMESN